MTERMSLLGCASLVVLAASIGTPAFAQDVGVARAAGQQGVVQLDEIIVTARKRTESVQDIPLSISATSGEQLVAQGVRDVETLASRVPGLSFKNAGAGRNEINIRGISSSGGRAPTVGFYLDESPIPAAGTESGRITIDPNLFDLARAEVLRGPQGTLYGASSLGGTVRLITNQPDHDALDFGFDITASSVEKGGIGFGGNAMINVPLAKDFAALRVVASYRQDAGFIDRVVVPTMGAYSSPEDRTEVVGLPEGKRYKDVNEAEVYGVRAQLSLKPAETITLTPSVFFQRTNVGGSPAFDVPPSGLNQYQPVDIAEPFNDEFRLYNITARWDLGSLELVSSTSRFERDLSEIEDSTETFGVALGGLYPTSAFIPGTVENSNSVRDFTQEVRLSSTGNGNFQWVMGGFYSRTSDTYSIDSTVPGFNAIFGTPQLIVVNLTSRIRQYAAFGEGTLKLADRFSINAGLRYFDYSSSFSSVSVGVLPNLGAGDPFDTRILGTGRASNKGFTPKISASFDVNDDVLLYATAGKGFRPGAPNAPIPAGTCDADFAAMGRTKEPSQYGPDSVWNYEVGAKTQWLDRKLTVNASLYRIDWSELQQRVELDCGFQYQDNLGEARSQGFELEIVARPAPNLTVNLGVSHNNAKLQRNVPGASKGQRVLNVPDWQANLSFDYWHDIGNNWRLIGRGGLQLIGESAANFATPQKRKSSYDLAQIRIGAAHDDFEVALFVDNVFNTVGVIDYRKSFGFGDTFESIVPTRPRTIGLTARYDF